LRGSFLYLAAFGVHFSLLVAGTFRDTAWVLGHGYTLLPDSLENFWKQTERVTEAALGRTLRNSNPLRQGVVAYTYSSGIEGAYMFFAPGVPSSFKLVFEVHNASGAVEYDLPRIHEPASAVRLSTLLDYVGRTEYAPLRELMVKVLTYSVWQRHPSASTIRAILGYIEEPTPAEARSGKKESYRVLYAYDFTFAPSTDSDTP